VYCFDHWRVEYSDEPPVSFGICPQGHGRVIDMWIRGSQMADVPMPRLPGYRRHRVRRREDVVAAAVAASLRTEGGAVENPYRPAEGQARSPDWMMTIHGEPTALEVTRLLPPSHVQKAHSVVTHIETGIRGYLAPVIVGVGGQVVLSIAYSARGVAERRRDRLASDTRILASEVRQTLNGLVEGPESIRIRSPLRWVLRADVALLPGPRDGFCILQQPDEAQPDLDDFVARTIAAKGDQHVGHAERAILAVDAMFDNAEDLREAFGRSPVAVPWWRVYLVLGSDATLVYEGSG